MLKRLGYFLALCIATFGCISKNKEDQATRFHEDGRIKPIVALFPVFDRSGTDIGWSLSDEFTDHLRERILNQNNFYLNTPEALHEVAAHLHEKHQPFTANTEWIKAAFKNHEFVVFTELVEYDIHDKPLTGNFLEKITPSSELVMTMRIRIFDLRSPHPEIILQELIHQTHLIPRPLAINEPQPERWKKFTFYISPMGLAHTQLVKEVEQRIEEYILLAKGQ